MKIWGILSLNQLRFRGGGLRRFFGRGRLEGGQRSCNVMFLFDLQLVSRRLRAAVGDSIPWC